MIKIDREKLFREIKRKRAKRVVLQFPEGLKSHAAELALFLEDGGISTIVAADPCFGACDLYEGEGLLVHFGHSPIYRPKRSALFYEVEDDFDFIPILSQNLSKLPKRLGLLTTVQHLRKFPHVSKYLGENGFEVYVGRGKGRIRNDGQVLGCNFSAAKSVEKKIDAFLYLGSGMFHPMGIALSTEKPVFRCYDTVEEVGGEKEKILKQRHGQLFRAGEAEKFGIIVSKKKGQKRMAEAREVKKMLEEVGKKVIIVEMDVISEEKVSSMGFDAYVMCACPRIAIDDAALWKKPVLTLPEVEILLGKRKGYSMDEIK